MFNNLMETIRQLNSDVNNVANCEKAKALRKKLLEIGTTMAIIGFGGAFICFILFATAGNDAFTDTGFSARMLVPFILLLPLAAVGGIGGSLISLGLKIVITGYTSNLIDETVGNNCPFCNDPISEGEIYCSKCGNKVKKECPSCKHINSYKNDYCEKCGTKLD